MNVLTVIAVVIAAVVGLTIAQQAAVAVIFWVAAKMNKKDVRNRGDDSSDRQK